MPKIDYSNQNKHKFEQVVSEPQSEIESSVEAGTQVSIDSDLIMALDKGTALEFKRYFG